MTNWGWDASPVDIGHMGYQATFTHVSNYYYYWTWADWTYVDGFGTPHPFNATATFVCQQQSGKIHCSGTGISNAVATDGSGYTLNVSFSTNPSCGNDFQPLVTTSDGNTINAYYEPQCFKIPISMLDRNGNEITVASGVYTDTLGQTALTTSGSGTSASPLKFTYTAPSGSPTYTVNYTTYKIQTNFGCSSVGDYGTNGTTTADLVSEIDLPDIASTPNDKYTFTYEPTYGHSGYVTGRLASVTLPTGGSITYSYGANGVNGIECADGSASTLTRTLSDGASWNATWTYARTLGTGTASATLVMAPKLPYDSAANQSILQFQGIYETQSDVYQGAAPTFTSVPISESTLQSSNLVQEVQTCYNTGTTLCTGTAVAMPISKQTVTTILSGLESQVVSSYNNFGQLTEEDDYGYGTGGPGALLRKKLVNITTVGSAQTVQQTTIQDGAGNVKAQTTICYDEGTPSGTTTCAAIGAPTATTGTPQHVSVSNASRANPTTIASLVSGTTTLGKTYTYYDTGNVNVATDVNGGKTTYSYGTGSCGNSFATGVTEAISILTQSYVWNCTGGVATSSTDENQNSVSATYTDANFWRPAYTKDQLGNQTNFTYTGQTQFESAMNFNGTTSTTDTLVTLDGLGRTHITQTKQGQGSSNYDSVESDYDVLSRPNRVTVPYSGTAGQTCSGCGATTTTYDALGRPAKVTDAGNGTLAYLYPQNDVLVTLGPKPSGETSTKSRQKEYDALGRLTSVCEVTAGTTAWPGGTCGQTSSAMGYWTKYTYDANGNLTNVTQNAQGSSQQTRTYAYDDLSRMTSETNPELGASGNGTVNYTYDSDSTCGTYTGDLVKIADAAGNVICNTYDAMHRNTSTTYPSGPNSSVTPSSHFVYDSATVNGATMNYAKARLAEAYTASSSCTSNCTDIGFSYTARGEVSDVYESTQHSGGYYHLTACYWANGALNLLNTGSSTTCTGQPVFSGLPTFTYGVDPEGRTNTVFAGSGQNPVTGTTYSLYTSPPQVAVKFGSNDSDAFNYDANTGRMTQYKFTVGAQPQSVVGALNWNANGSLGSLTITDPFYTGNVQTCTYVHDDLERIGGSSTTPGVNCVNGSQTVWSNDFAYDAFGNINKSGSSFFNAGYNSATNRMNSVGSCTPLYDSNGDATNDCTNTYTWDANGRPLKINGVGATYDALGRMVELTRSGPSYTEIVYDPTGNKVALMNAQTLASGFVPLPGNAMAVYNSSGMDHYRHSDWLGSARLFSSPAQTVLGEVAYSPFGETYAQMGLADFSFTGLNDDADHTNPALVYDFPAREYGIQGRWPSPDPLGLGAVDPANPQSWNRYVYVVNDPLNLVDPSGMDGECDQNGCTVTVTGPYPGAGSGGNNALGQLMPPGCVYSPGCLCKFRGNCAQVFPRTQKALGGFTLGVRVPGQTFNQCMVANATNYSAGGAFDLTAGTSIGNSTAGQILAANAFTGLYSALNGSAGDAATAAGTTAPDLLNSAMGSTLTFGRRTSNILALNLAGKGGLPLALSSSSGGLKSLLGSTSKALNLGLDASLKAAGDLGLFGAEIIGCSIHK